MYKKRWGMDTGYRMTRKSLAKTTSKGLNIKLLYFYHAINVYDLWIFRDITSRIMIIADVMKVLVSATNSEPIR